MRPPIRMTGCGHSFCEQFILAACPEPSGWLCPVCNHVHDHPATALARNFFAQQIVESFQAQPSPAATRPICEFGICTLHKQEITLC